MTKPVIILRGVSGSGKSTLADFLYFNLFDAGLSKNVICCADDYFIDKNTRKYVFDITKLGAAHKWCQKKFDEALIDPDVNVVIVSNTNTKESDFKYYLEKAKEFDCRIFSLVVENRHGNTDIHSVPKETLENQKKNIYNSLKLI